MFLLHSAVLHTQSEDGRWALRVSEANTVQGQTLHTFKTVHKQAWTTRSQVPVSASLILSKILH